MYASQPYLSYVKNGNKEDKEMTGKQHKKNIQQDTVKRDISIQYTASESTKGRSADKSTINALYRKESSTKTVQ